jgi:hypothetical protein
MVPRNTYPPEEEGVGVADLNMIAFGLSGIALGLCAVQFALFGHFARVTDAGGVIGSGWLVTIFSFGSLLLLTVSASKLGPGCWRNRLSYKFLAPFALAVTLFVVSGLSMLEGSPDVRAWQKSVGIYYWAQSR